MDNDRLIEKTVEITVAKLSGTDTNTTQSVGMNVAQFMQGIYDKLVELNKIKTNHFRLWWISAPPELLPALANFHSQLLLNRFLFLPARTHTVFRLFHLLFQASFHLFLEFLNLLLDPFFHSLLNCYFDALHHFLFIWWGVFFCYNKKHESFKACSFYPPLYCKQNRQGYVCYRYPFHLFSPHFVLSTVIHDNFLL